MTKKEMFEKIEGIFETERIKGKESYKTFKDRLEQRRIETGVGYNRETGRIKSYTTLLKAQLEEFLALLEETVVEAKEFEDGTKNQMLAIIYYDSYSSEKMICEVEQDIQEGIERGYRQPERYYTIKEIFYDTQDNKESLLGKEIEEVLGRRISTWESIGVTYLFESYIMPITEDEKDILLKFLNNRVNEKEQVVLNLINGWKDVSPEDRETYLQNTMQKIDSLKTKQGEMRELFLKEIRLHVEFLKEKAKKEGKKQLYFKNLVPCNEYKEECNWDLLCRYIDEDGNEVVTREHTH